MLPRITTVVAVFSLITFSSCLTAKKMDKWIDKQYGGVVPAKIRSSEYMTIKTENLSSKEHASNSQKGDNKLLPAFFYWQWKFSTISTLNQNIPVSNLSSTIFPYSNAKGLRQKLNGQKIELTIDKIPAVFSITDKGGLVYALLWYVSWETIYIEPENQDMVISYKILKDNVETKKGAISVANRDKSVALKMFQSAKKMTWNYLDQYDMNIKAMSKEFVDKLMLEL